MTDTKTFLRITNKDIYDKLVDLEKRSSKLFTMTKVNSGAIAIIIIILAAIIKAIV